MVTMVRRCIAVAVLVLVLGAVTAPEAVHATDSPHFRGPERDGVFPATGLLQSWPDGGPKLLWTASGLGESYASVSVADGKVFTTGKDGETGKAFAIGDDGTVLWSVAYGPAHNGSGYPGTRTTPTYDDGRVYLLSSMGKAVALDAATGETVWEADLLARFEGENIHFGISESPLIDGDRVIFTPGGKDASVVALDKKTGATVWTTKGLSDISAYCNPRLITFSAGKRQIVTLVKENLVGIDPASGEVLWRQKVPAQYDIHATSPVAVGDLIYISHGYDQGGKAYRLAADGRSVAQAWTEDKLDVHHGGAVAVDGHIYGASSKKTWYALDAASGEIKAEIKRLGKGAVVYADGRLYGYVESGDVVLVNPDPASFEVVGRFAIDQGEGHHWSHPVIADGVLYIRHGDVLMAYDVKKPS